MKVHQIFPYLAANKINIFFAQESWLRKCDGAILKTIKEYGFKFFSDRKSCQLDWGGGVATFYQSSLNIKSIRMSKYQSFEFVACKVLSSHGVICIVNIYRPGYSSKHRFTVNQFVIEFRSLWKTFFFLTRS